MWKIPIDENLFDKFGKYTKIAGSIFIIVGLLGIIYPNFMTFATVTFVAWLMLFSGIMAGYFTWLSDKHNMVGWLKTFILIGVSFLMLFYPMSGVATLGLLLAIYFFMDGFAGVSLALSIYPNKGWGLWFINAIFSILVGILFIAGWPFTSVYLVGLLVGFSLFFDGIAIFLGGSIFKKMMK